MYFKKDFQFIIISLNMMKKGTSFANFVLMIEYCNLTKFGQDWTENKFFYQNAKFWQDPFLNFVDSNYN